MTRRNNAKTRTLRYALRRLFSTLARGQWAKNLPREQLISELKRRGIHTVALELPPTVAPWLVNSSRHSGSCVLALTHSGSTDFQKDRCDASSKCKMQQHQAHRAGQRECRCLLQAIPAFTFRSQWSCISPSATIPTEFKRELCWYRSPLIKVVGEESLSTWPAAFLTGLWAASGEEPQEMVFPLPAASSET